MLGQINKKLEKSTNENKLWIKSLNLWKSIF